MPGSERGLPRRKPHKSELLCCCCCDRLAHAATQMDARAAQGGCEG